MWVLDTKTGAARHQGMKDTCVQEDFYRVVGPGGQSHNQFERMMAVLDDELARLLVLFRSPTLGGDVTFDDFMALGHMMALQRTRTPQIRRLLGGQIDFLHRHDRPVDEGDAMSPQTSDASMHTRTMFDAMYGAADVMATRYIELWDDPKGRFITSDVPIHPSGRGYIKANLTTADRIWWPLSPTRALALAKNGPGVKFTISRANTRVVDEVNTLMIRGRENTIIARQDQLSLLPVGKPLRRRMQNYIHCAPADYDKCKVSMLECYADGPDINVCDTHPRMSDPLVHA